jgi:hypothetical protein
MQCTIPSMLSETKKTERPSSNMQEEMETEVVACCFLTSPSVTELTAAASLSDGGKRND